MLTLSGLKHVSDQEKTHKNPNLRGQSSAVRSGPKPFASPAARPASSATTAGNQPPVFELDGKKWRVVSFWLKNSPSGLMGPYFKSSLPFCSHLLWSDQLLVLISCLKLFFYLLHALCRRIRMEQRNWWSAKRSPNKLCTVTSVTTVCCRSKAKSTPSPLVGSLFCHFNTIKINSMSWG